MNSEMWIVGTLLTSILLIVVTIVKGKVHPFLALLLASFYVGALMGMNPLKMVNAMEEGIGGTLGFLAAVIGLGTILGKMMEVSGAAERIGLALQQCRWLSPQVTMVLVGLVCGITLFVEVGVVLLIPLAFSIARKTNTSLLTLAIPLCTALMAVHCIVPPHPAALYVTNQLGADVGSATVAMMGATAIVSPIMVHYPNISPEIMTLAIGSGAIGCTMVTDSLFWLVKQYCGATLNETLKYYTTATFVASLMALAGTFLLSCIV